MTVARLAMPPLFFLSTPVVPGPYIEFGLGYGQRAERTHITFYTAIERQEMAFYRDVEATIGRVEIGWDYAISKNTTLNVSLNHESNPATSADAGDNRAMINVRFKIPH